MSPPAAASACQVFRPCNSSDDSHIHWNLLREGSRIVPLGENLFAGCHGNTVLAKQTALDFWVPYAPSLNRPQSLSSKL